MDSDGLVSLDEILDLALEYQASDIHFKANMPPVFRIDGLIRSLPGLPAFSADILRTLITSILTPRQQQIFEETYELDTALVFADKARVRLNVYLDVDSIGCAMRIVPLDVPTIAELSLPKVIEDLTHTKQGLVLVTGVTGTGKSTTLAAMINAINERDALHVYTMEDPIEFVHRPKCSIITQREIGFTTKNFGNALRAAMRADPDVLLIGEMRDAFTIQMGIRAAETGHLVFSTLHTPSAPKTIQRLLGVFTPAAQETIRTQLAHTLKAIVAQQLIPLIGGGRMAVNEILINTSTVQEAILRGDIDSILEFIKNGSYDGMQTMDGAIYNAFRQGLIDAETAKNYADNKGEMERILRGAISR